MNLMFDFCSPHVKDNIAIRFAPKNTAFPKSPLRYPGGKARAVEIILSIIPGDIKVLVSPFFGGGSVEIAVNYFGIDVRGYDSFEPLVYFWQTLLDDPDALADNAERYYPLSRDDFYKLQKSYPTSKLDIATQFYVLNRSSFSGATMSGGMSPGHPRFTRSSIEYLRRFKLPNLTVNKQDFHLTLMYESDEFLYLDPPYLIDSNLYGRNGSTHKDFDHEGLFALLSKRNKWILSYNNCPVINDLYKNFRMLYPKWKYGMSTDKDSKELIILSDDIPDLQGK